MSSPRASPWDRGLLALGVVVFAAAFVVVLVQLRIVVLVNLVGFGIYLVVGGLIVRRRGNRLGLLLVAYGAFFSVGKAALVSAEWLDEAGRTREASWVALVGLVAVSPGSWLIAATWLVFPDGRPRTAGDRRLLLRSGALMALSSLTSVFATPQVLPEADKYPHPFVDDGFAEVALFAHQGAFVMFFMLAFFVAARLLLRTRRGNPVEARQVRWIATAVILNIAILLANAAFTPLGTEDDSFLLIDTVASSLVPLAIGVAILRYRLYEIDRIISRSVTYGTLVVFIGGVYVATVVGLGAYLDRDAGFGVSIAATALAAIAFQPLRRSVERWAKRLVYGERATPHEILVDFSRRSSELSDDELIDQVPKLVADGAGAASATLWVRVGNGFRTASTWPPITAERTADGLDDLDEFVDPESDWSWPVMHDGESLGGISLTKEPGETVSMAESALLADLANGLGLALRNTRLTTELQQQVDELEASRQRVMAAADAARRELEHTLDSGPQQQLVALKVKLGPTRKRAEQLGATKAAQLLGQLEDQAGEAIVAVRELARGIYPPVLETDGLERAIGQHARASAVPVSLRAEDLGRYPPEVERAVYFSVLEALQNTTKYASADSATVRLAVVNGSLEFEITDDGEGFDTSAVGHGSGLGGIADRLDAIGGSLTVRSVPGHGTTIAGTVPTETRAGV